MDGREKNKNSQNRVEFNIVRGMMIFLFFSTYLKHIGERLPSSHRVAQSLQTPRYLIRITFMNSVEIHSINCLWHLPRIKLLSKNFPIQKIKMIVVCLEQGRLRRRRLNNIHLIIYNEFDIAGK